MLEYHVGCGTFGIYAGILNPKNKNIWKDKTDVTEEAIVSVRDNMIREILGGIECKKCKSGGWEWNLKNGKIVELRITIKDNENNDE